MLSVWFPFRSQMLKTCWSLNSGILFPVDRSAVLLHGATACDLVAESRLHMYMCWRGSQLGQVCRTCSKGCSDSSSCHAQGWGVQRWCSSIFPAVDLY